MREKGGNIDDFIIALLTCHSFIGSSVTRYIINISGMCMFAFCMFQVVVGM